MSPARIRRSISAGEGSAVADLFGIDIHVFVTDIHDPKLQRHFGLIGKIPLLWSEIEFAITQVIAGFNRDSIHSKEQLWFLLARLGNRDRPDVLELMNEKTSLGPRGDACVAFALEAYRALNQNRNTLLHAHAVSFDKPSEIVWTRFSSGKKERPAHTHVPLRELEFQLRSYERLRNFLLQLFGAVWAQNNPDCSPPRWPRKFPAPRLLAAIPPDGKIPKASQRKPKPQRKPRASP